MEKYTIPALSMMALAFTGLWALVYQLHSGLTKGVVTFRDSAFLRKGSGMRNASDFWGVMFAYFLFSSLFAIMLAIATIALSNSAPEIVLVSLAIFMNTCIAARRSPTKKSVPNRPYSYTSLFMTSLFTVGFISFALTKGSNQLYTVIAITVSTLSALVHTKRLYTGKFIFKFKKVKPSKLNHSRPNA